MRRKKVFLPLLCILAVLGFAGAALAVEHTATSTSCATTTAGKYTLAEPTTTEAFGGDELAVCATATATATDQTITNTTTVPGPTTTVTTTVQASSPTFASETAYTQTPPSFTIQRIVTFTDRTTLNNAVANALPGDLIRAASTPLTISFNNTSGGVLNISKRLTSLAELDLRGVTIKSLSTAAGIPAVYLTNPAYWYIEGGDVTDPSGGGCVIWFAGQHITWWHFNVHDCAATGLGVATSSSAYSYGGPIQNNDIEGDVSHTGLIPSRDNHAELCTGMHALNLADGNFFAVSGNRVAINAHDIGCSGGGISFGSNSSPTTTPSGPIPDSNTIILQCANLSFVSTTQTGGNCYQTWGYGNTNTDLKYVVSDNIQGHNVWAGGLYSIPNSKLATDTIEYARATATDLNPRYANDCTNNKEGNPVFLDALPVPCYAPFSS